jgi:hypothetical protein
MDNHINTSESATKPIAIANITDQEAKASVIKGSGHVGLCMFVP